MRCCRKEKKMCALLAEQLAKTITLAFMLGISRRHPMGLIDDDQIPVLGLPDARQDLFTLCQVHRGNDLVMIVPEIDSVLHTQVASAQDAERLLKPVVQLSLPLESEICRAND